MVEQTNWRLVWLLWAAGLGAAAQYGKISVIFDRLPEVYPDAGPSLGFAVSLVGLLGILLGVFAGVMVARIGYRRALLSALCVGAVVSVLQSFWPPLPIFLGLRIIEGAAHLALVVAAPTLIAQVTAPTDHGKALTLWGSFFGVAFAVLAWGGAPLAHTWGLGALLVAHGVYMAAMALMLWRPLPTLVSRPAPIKLGVLMHAHWRIYRSARIGAPAMGWLFYTFCFVSVLTVFPPFVAEGARAFTLGAMPLVSILVSLTLGVALLRRWSAVSVIVLGFVICGVSALCLAGITGNPGVALVLAAGLGLVQGATFALVPELNDAAEDRALANGGLAQMGNLGNTMGTPVMLLVIATAGYVGLMVALCVVFALGAGAHLWLARSRGQKI